MSKPKYPWPLSLIMTPHVFTDGAELWPSGREEFSYLSPDKRRIKFVVANPLVERERQYVVFTNSIRTFTDGAVVDPETKGRVVQAAEEYFRTKGQNYKLEVA
jgi:hypothetical protein